MTKMLQKLLNKSKKNNKKINKTMNKSTLKKCEDFCKKDYMVEMNKVFKKSSKKYNVPYNPTKQDNDFAYQTCKKTFCNEKCEGYDNLAKTKNGFQKTYSTHKVDMLKKKGALSGCVDIMDYDVFHK
jgi:hypothetical protein